MKKNFLALRGFFFSFFQKRIKSNFEEKSYFCYPLDHFLDDQESFMQMGVAYQHKDMTTPVCYSIMSTKDESIERFLECFYRFLHGIVQLNMIHSKSVKIVFPYYWYFLVIMNLKYWKNVNPKAALLIQGIAELLTSLVNSNNNVEITGSWAWKSGLKTAKTAIQKRNILK